MKFSTELSTQNVIDLEAPKAQYNVKINPHSQNVLHKFIALLVAAGGAGFYCNAHKISENVRSPFQYYYYYPLIHLLICTQSVQFSSDLFRFFPNAISVHCDSASLWKVFYSLCFSHPLLLFCFNIYTMGHQQFQYRAVYILCTNTLFYLIFFIKIVLFFCVLF